MWCMAVIAAPARSSARSSIAARLESRVKCPDCVRLRVAQGPQCCLDRSGRTEYADVSPLGCN
jgi:hypothetical protein